MFPFELPWEKKESICLLQLILVLSSIYTPCGILVHIGNEPFWPLLKKPKQNPQNHKQKTNPQTLRNKPQTSDISPITAPSPVAAQADLMQEGNFKH